MGFFKDLKKRVRGMQNQMQPPMSPRPTSMGNKFDRMFGMSRRQAPSPMMRGGAEFGPPSLEDMLRNQAPGTVIDLETGLPPVRLPEITENIGVGAMAPDKFMPGGGMRLPEYFRYKEDEPLEPQRNLLRRPRRLPQIIPERMPSPRPTPRFFGGGLRNIFSRLPNQRVRERMSPPLPRAPLPMPVPERMPRERFPMMRPGFAEGEEVRSGMRSGATGPRVQNISKQVLRPSLGGTISAAARGAAMSPISKFGIPGAIAAGGIALYQIADEMGYVPEIGKVDPEAIGRGAASVDKAFMEVVNEAVDMARDIGAPIQDFVERVKMGYQDEMGAGIPEPDPREVLGETGRTLSNIDRQMLSRRAQRSLTGGLGTTQEFTPPPPVMGEVPMFAEGLDVDIANLEKKN